MHPYVKEISDRFDGLFCELDELTTKLNLGDQGIIQIQDFVLDCERDIDSLRDQFEEYLEELNLDDIEEVNDLYQRLEEFSIRLTELTPNDSLQDLLDILEEYS